MVFIKFSKGSVVSKGRASQNLLMI